MDDGRFDAWTRWGFGLGFGGLTMGCGPGFGGSGCTGNPCGWCTFFCPPETPLCCGVGPAAVPTCVAGTFCP